MATAIAPPQVSIETRPPRGALLVLLAGVFTSLLDFFIVNVALPDTQRDLHAGPSAVQFIVAGYGLALAAGLITAGRLGDMYGRRKMYVLGLGLFTLASAACGLAPSAGFLVAARVVQGGAAALLMPQILAIINTSFTGPARARAFTAYGMTVGFGAVFGQLVGGVLIKVDLAGLGWRSIFLINIPIGLAAVALAPRLLPESRAAGGGRIDLVGAVLVTLGLVAIVLPLVEGQQQGWPTWVFVSLAASIPLLAAFALHQRRLAAGNGSPLVNLALFRERAFSAGMVISLTYQLMMASFFLVLALFLQDGLGLSALQSGLIFLPLGLGYFAASVQSGKIAARLGPQVLALGSLVVSAGYLLLAANLHARRRLAHPRAGGLRGRHGPGDRPDARDRAGPGEARARGGRLRGAVHHPAGGRLDRGRGHRGGLLQRPRPRLPARLRARPGGDGRLRPRGRRLVQLLRRSS